MKKILMLALLWMPVAGLAGEQGTTGLTAHNINENRTSLNLTPRMKHRLLSNMRAQLAATQTIIGLLAAARFDRASTTARSRLGMSDDLKQVYGTARNDGLNQLLLATQASVDELANTLQTKDLNKSLLALRDTMGYCVQCHKRFRQ